MNDMLKGESMIFFTDLDNTLIYSYRHEIGTEKLCAEIYQGREVSFVTLKTWKLLKKVKEKALIIPVTTRTQEQYGRIDLKVAIPDYALVCNGGVLLIGGKEDFSWYQESLALIVKCQAELERAQDLMDKDSSRSFEVRNIRNLFLFTKSSDPGKSAAYLKERLDMGLVEVFQNGVKVYVLPKKLNKGAAVTRLIEKLQREGKQKGLVLAAGDSGFDIPMLRQADISFAPEALRGDPGLPANAIVVGGEEIFSEAVLEKISKMNVSNCSQTL